MNTGYSHPLATRTPLRAPLALALAAALGVAALPGMAQAATYTVTSAGDAGSGTCTATCTLRDAVAAATSGSDTVTFASTLSGDTITLDIANKGHIAITHNLTIQGPGANLLTVSGGNVATSANGGIFYTSGYALSISGITLADGNTTGYGGALMAVSSPNVTLSQVALVNNHAKGGGGFYERRGAFMVTHSTISGNSAGSFGGGFCSQYGAVTLTDSTVAGNSAGSVGSGSGGGFYMRGALLTVNSSTISGNSSQAGSGFELNAFSGSLTNSIVSANSNPLEQFLSTGQGQTTTLTVSYSLINGSYYVGNGATFSGSHLITGQDPKLGTLAYNGGPTQTLALLPGSPAIDAGSNGTCETTDQRGVTRPDGKPGGSGTCDMGAFEVDTIFANGFE